MSEIWKSVVGYEGYYEVSNHGNVRGIDRIVPHSYSKKLTLKGMLLKQIKCKDGYKQVTLSKNRIARPTKVHKLVAKAFIENLEGKPYINHKNGIKTDNRVENLEWCTGKENSQHAHDNNLVDVAKGERQALAKLTDEQVIEMRKLRLAGWLYKDIAPLFGVNNHTTRWACVGLTWKHIDFSTCPYRKNRSSKTPRL